MKLHKQTKIVMSIAATALLLSACGGGGGKKAIDKNISEIANCSTNNFTSLKKGDKVTALTNDTEVRLRHNQNGEKVVCIEKGKAKIN